MHIAKHAGDRQFKDVVFAPNIVPHCKSPHSQREFKYLFIFWATKHIHSYKTVQYKHASADTFNAKVFFCFSLCWLWIYVVISMYVTLSLWLDLFLWYACISGSARKRSLYDYWAFPRIINWLRFSFTKEEGAWRTLSVSWERLKHKHDQVRVTGQKTAKTAIAHEMKFSPNFVLCIENIKKACVVVVA